MSERSLSTNLASLSLGTEPATAPGRGLLLTKPYYGSLCSQYPTLDTQTISVLEKAILLSKVRAFAESGVTFDSLLSSGLESNPIILFERFLDYLNQWKLYDGARILEKALARAENNPTLWESNGYSILIRVYLAQIEAFTKGDFTRARHALPEVRRWLSGTPIESYTDIQVGIRNNSMHSAPQYTTKFLSRSIV